MIYHMLPAIDWEATPAEAPYRAASLENEGFIHCSGDYATLLMAGNSFYRHLPGAWLILAIDENRVDAPVQWDAVLDGVGESRFPHIYGPLNRSAVVEIIDFPRAADGAFEMPPAGQGAA